MYAARAPPGLAEYVEGTGVPCSLGSPPRNASPAVSTRRTAPAMSKILRSPAAIGAGIRAPRRFVELVQNPDGWLAASHTTPVREQLSEWKAPHGFYGLWPRVGWSSKPSACTRAACVRDLSAPARYPRG